MTQTEVGELLERAKSGAGRSSTMPQKRNPILVQDVLVAGKLARLKLPGLMESMIQDHERGSATWQMEWSLIPDLCSHSMFALKSSKILMETLVIHEDRMQENLKVSDSMVYAESIMMALASTIGRQNVHDLVDKAVTHSLSGVLFVEALQKTPEIQDNLSIIEMGNMFSRKVHCKMRGNVCF